MRALIFAAAMAVTAVVPHSPAAALPGVDQFRSGSSPMAPGTVSTGIGIRLIDIPSATQDDPRARTYIVDNLPPGTKIERRIEVRNNSSTPRTVRVYPGAARVRGGSFIGEAGAAANELTAWTTVDQPAIDLRPGTSADVRVTIEVPPDAAQGERYAAIWAEVRSAADTETGVVNASRAGIRMYVSVAPGSGPRADFSISSLSARRSADGVPEVRAEVTNTGGRALDISGALTLSEGPSGLSAGPYSSESATTLVPDATQEMTIALGPDLPSGPWQANLELRSGLITHQASAKIVFPDAGQRAPVHVAEDVRPSDWPWIGLGVVLVVTAGVAAWGRKRSRLRTVARYGDA